MPDSALDDLDFLLQHLRDQPLDQLKITTLTQSQASQLLLRAIKTYPSLDLICFLKSQGGILPVFAFHWLLQKPRMETFRHLLRAGYKPNPHLRDTHYGVTLFEYALATKNYRALSLITERNLLRCFLTTRLSQFTLGNQSWLIRRLQLLGFPVKSRGICYATALFGGQAVLIGEAEYFMRRTTLIKDTPYLKLPKKWAKAYQRRQRRKPLLQTQQDYLDFFDFGHAVELLQGQYPEFAEALNENKDMPRVFFNSLQSIELEKAGGIKWIGSECEVMIDLRDKANLTSYVSALQTLFDRSDRVLVPQQAVFVYISAVRHGVSLGYDIKTRQWYFVDANHSEVMVKTPSIDDVVLLLHDAYASWGKKMKFGFSLFTTGNNEIPVKAMVEYHWHRLHQQHFQPVAAPKSNKAVGYAFLSASYGAYFTSLIVASIYQDAFLAALSILSITSPWLIAGLFLAIGLTTGLLAATIIGLVSYLLSPKQDETIIPIDQCPQPGLALSTPSQQVTWPPFFKPPPNHESSPHLSEARSAGLCNR